MSMPIFLSPGAICCPAEPAVVTTILGSCVAVCLYDRNRRSGGMNHFLLPRCGSAPPSPRYGDVAFTMLLTAMERLGCRAMDLRAKVFGGAAVLPFGAQADTVGAQNVAVALEVLQLHGIPVMARRTGGQRGLFLRFNTVNGRVMVRELGDDKCATEAGAGRIAAWRGG
ncbi:MAG TPA: chemotaxis protein CheD [Acetobacteraceae bacterium]|nr:chemotaxis protein CheD [Acetobacteraceae bacterium]